MLWIHISISKINCFCQQFPVFDPKFDPSTESTESWSSAYLFFAGLGLVVWSLASFYSHSCILSYHFSLWQSWNLTSELWNKTYVTFHNDDWLTMILNNGFLAFQSGKASDQSDWVVFLKDVHRPQCLVPGKKLRHNIDILWYTPDSTKHHLAAKFLLWQVEK